MAAIQKWGNRQGIRFPNHVLEEAGLAVGDEVKVRHGAIVVRPVRRVRGKYRLKALLARMPADYAPAEEGWGMPAGKEVW